jgi:hypothetical protein
MFEHFFAIPKEEINRALAVPMDVDDQQSRWQQCLSDPQRSVHWKEAQGLHAILITARKLQGDPHIALEDYLFLAGHAAKMVASDATRVAMKKEPLKRLRKRLDRIKARAGRAHQLGWVNGDGPANYEKASDEFVSFYFKLNDTLLTAVFQRYGLTLALELFESDYCRYSRLYAKGVEKHGPKSPQSARVYPPVSEMPALARTYLEQGLRLRSRSASVLTGNDPLEYSI